MKNILVLVLSAYCLAEVSARVVPTRCNLNPETDFDCPSQSGLYPHKECHKFWHCSNCYAYEKLCPSPFVWNKDFENCDFPNNVDLSGCHYVGHSSSTAAPDRTTGGNGSGENTTDVEHSDCSDQCDKETCTEIPLHDLVIFSVEVASIKFGENNLCKIAEYVQGYVNRHYKVDDWVVLVGSNSLFQTPFDYASTLNYQQGTFIRYLHKHKISIEMFRPKVGTHAPEDLVKSNFNSNKSPRTIHYETDMPARRKFQFTSLINTAFDKNNGNFQRTSEDIYHGIGSIATGDWAVFVARNGMLANEDNFCAVYDRYLGTYYLGTYERVDSGIGTHEVLVFAPGKSSNAKPTPAPTSAPTHRPSTSSPSVFHCPSDYDCTITMCLYQDHLNCSQFWQCYSDGTKYLHQCPNGFEFNDLYKACDWPPSPTCNKN